jgi:hypothetical protein
LKGFVRLTFIFFFPFRFVQSSVKEGQDPDLSGWEPNGV